MVKQRPTEKTKDQDPQAQLKELAIVVAQSVATVEAKLWGSFRFLIEKGLFTEKDYEKWMKEHERELTDATRAFLGRIEETFNARLR